MLLEEDWYTGAQGFGDGKFNELAVQDGSWTRLREASISYTLNKGLGKVIDNIELSVAGRNLIIWTEVEGIDPDVNQFGRGYGEENDFCQRAEKASFHNVLCDDAYVVHHGGASFQPLGLSPGEESMQRLLAKHPDYQDKVMEFIHTDPLAPRRQEILDCLQRKTPSFRA